jgi:TetR/AcrR family fatty acid metabolism transcriptional regulator
MNKHSESFRQRRRDTTVELLVGAAETAIARVGYDAVTMNEIAAEAGCATGTLYLYFKDKQQLVMALVERHGRIFRERIEKAFAAGTDPLDKLRRATLTFLEYFNQNRNYFKILNASNLFRRGVLPEALPKPEQEARKRFLAANLEVIRQAQAQGLIRKDFSPEEVGNFMRACVVGLMDQLSLLEKLPPVEEQMRGLWAFMTGGLGARGS